MFRTLLRRPVATAVITTFFALALSSTSALACKNNPFNSAQLDDGNLPLIAANDTGKCGGEKAPESKPAESMACGAGKCGSSMSTGGKPSGEEKKCEGSAAPEGKPTEEKTGKCGGN
jgi:hypothetical protein